MLLRKNEGDPEEKTWRLPVGKHGEFCCYCHGIRGCEHTYELNEDDNDENDSNDGDDGEYTSMK